LIALGLFNAPLRKPALTWSSHKDTIVSIKTQLFFETVGGLLVTFCGFAQLRGFLPQMFQTTGKVI